MMTHARKEVPMNDVILTPLAVSIELKRSVGFVRNAALDGRLPAIRTTTNRLLFRQTDVDALKAELEKEQRQEPTGAA
jgi:hypothetical protein